jgi:hypothetical protein
MSQGWVTTYFRNSVLEFFLLIGELKIRDPELWNFFVSDKKYTKDCPLDPPGCIIP